MNVRGKRSKTEAWKPRIVKEAKTSIFICHPSAHLTDFIPNGDGLIAHGFISRLAERGYDLHIACEQVSLRQPLPANVKLYPIKLRAKQPGFSHIEYAIRMRILYTRLRRQHDFSLILQLNPVFPGLSLALIGAGEPIILGTYVPRWTESKTKDGYTGSSGFAAHLRNLVVALQQMHADALLLTTPAAINRVPFPLLSKHKIRELPHGIDPETFAPATGIGLRPTKNVLFLASLSERKGVLDLLSAFALVQEHIPESSLTIVGPGDTSKILERLRTLKLEHCVRILGTIARQDAPDLYRSHAVYCLPSYGEPYATSIIEAMAVGLPVVSTSAGGTPYLLPNDGGYLVVPGDVNGIATALIGILESTSLRHSMGQANRQAILQRFQWSTVIDSLEEIYSEVTSGAVGSRPPTR